MQFGTTENETKNAREKSPLQKKGKRERERECHTPAGNTKWPKMKKKCVCLINPHVFREHFFRSFSGSVSALLGAFRSFYGIWAPSDHYEIIFMAFWALLVLLSGLFCGTFGQFGHFWGLFGIVSGLFRLF